jgi:tetratricopeptide (TPR) repeat protein
LATRRKYVAASPDNIHWQRGLVRDLNNVCWSRAILGQLAKALSACDEALQKSPNDANTLDSRGFAHLKLQMYKEAIADYDAALAIEHELASSLYGRGVAKLRLGDEAGGRADIAAATEKRSNVIGEFARYGIE